MRYRRHVVLGGLVAGLAGPELSAAVPVALAGAALALAAGRRWTAPALVPAALAVAVGAIAADARLAALDRTALTPWLGHAADATVVVLDAPRRRSFGRVAALARLASGPGRGEHVLLRGGRGSGVARLSVGERARVAGGWRALPGFESAARRRGAHALIAATSVHPTGRRGGPAGALDGVRRRADRGLSAGLPPPLAALARGMVLGEDEALDDELRDDFRASGLAHLVAASGANVALLAAMVMAVCALAGLPLRVRLALVLVAIAGYVPLAGGGPSIQRAGVMGAAAVVAALASRPASRWYALLLAAALTLALNPRAAADPGWQLSFAAVLALLLVAPRLRDRLARRLPRGVADAVAISLAASLGTAPLIALHFERVSLIGVPANVVVAPAVAPIMGLGALAAVVAQVSAAAASPIMALAAWPLAFVAAVGHLAAGLPAAQVAAPAWVVTGVTLVVAVLVAVPAARRIARRRVVLFATLGVALLAAPLAGSRITPAPPRGLVVSALDVGQGDATLIQDAGLAVLVDTGPPDGPIVHRLRDAGVRRIDLLVITHAQADHEGGAAAVVGALSVGLVLDGRDGRRTPDGDRLEDAAEQRGVRILAASAGQRLRVGPIVLDVLWPRPEPAGLHTEADPNQRAIVAELRDRGFSMLLTADAESDVTSALALGPVDVLKVAHHGSADPGLPDLLRRLRPRIALVEVGRRNVYGHPTPETLRQLRAVPQVLRTDRDGTIRLHVGPARIAVDRHA